MTRVNIIPIKEMSDQHLMAEYRELPRVIHDVERWVSEGKGPDDIGKIPESYNFGEGHIKFFAIRLLWIGFRLQDVQEELTSRGYLLNHGIMEIWGRILDLPTPWLNDWKPTEAELDVSRAKINEKVAEKPKWYKYSPRRRLAEEVS